MSEQQPKQVPTNQVPSNLRVIQFIIALSLICALILAALASALKEPQELAQELDRSKQMLIAAQIYTHAGYFQIRNEKNGENGKDGESEKNEGDKKNEKNQSNEYIPAKHIGDGVLVPGAVTDIADKGDIVAVIKRRLTPKLVTSDGDLKTFSDAGINLDQYIAKYKKTGYWTRPEKLVYEILPNPKSDKEADKEAGKEADKEAGKEEKGGVESGGGEKAIEKPIGYVVPVNGFGLWDAIYGYIAIETDGETVIGISWYEQKETPGLGANIADEPWQKEFPGKLIFQPSADGQVDLKTAPIGITVVKGKVAEVLGDVPKSKAAVDGMPGATLTGNGVTTAYREVLGAYRPFFIKINEASKAGAKKI